MSDRTHALLSPPVPSLTPAEDDAAAMAALLHLLAETGYNLRVSSSSGWLVLSQGHDAQVMGITVPDLLQQAETIR
jgi:hypothetical protein